MRRIVGERPGPGAHGADDAAALQSIGIDLDAVRARIKETFGTGALEVERQTRPARWRRRRAQGRRGCGSAWPITAGGHIPFTPRSKKTLELALREALRLRHGFIGTEHILLGVLRQGEGLAAEILVGRGVNLDDLRRRLLAAMGDVA